MPSRSLDHDTIREIVDAVARSLEAVPRALEQQLAAVEVPLPPPTTPATLTAAVRSLREATAQVDLLRRLLAAAADRGARAALFVLRDDRLVGWEGTGFDDEPELAGDLSTRALPADTPAVERVLASATPVACSVDGDFPVPDFGQTLRGEAWLHPLRVADRIAAVLYTDPAGAEAPDLEGIAVLVETAGLVVERLAASRAARPAPGPAGPTTSQPVAAAPSPAETPGEAPEPPAPEGPASGTGSGEAAEESRPEETPQPAPGEEAGEGDDLEAVEVALELEGTPGEGEPPPPEARAEATAPDAGAADDGVAGEGEPGTAADDDTGVGFEIMTPEELGAKEADESAEEDARRFARLLMQEIVLYHRDEVEKGRAGHDLLARLADPIANARRLYEQRVPEDQPARMAWFEEEMIRILAEGDPDLLGQPEGQEA